MTVPPPLGVDGFEDSAKEECGLFSAEMVYRTPLTLP
jgi:hypothetical protein